MKQLFLSILLSIPCVLGSSRCLGVNPFAQDPVYCAPTYFDPNYCLAPGYAFQPKFRYYADVVVNDIADDAVHYAQAAWYNYYSY